MKVLRAWSAYINHPIEIADMLKHQSSLAALLDIFIKLALIFPIGGHLSCYMLHFLPLFYSAVMQNLLSLSGFFLTCEF